MEELLELAKNKYNSDEFEAISKTYSLLSHIKTDNKIYNINFSRNLAIQLIENKLDFKSIITGLYYPFYITDKITDDNLDDDEIISMLNSLKNLNSFNVSNRENQLS